jgi:hypothetical protein
MRKGQLSLDLILTMIVALIIISAFLVIINDFKSNQEIRLAKEQLDLIGQNTATLISTTQTISDTKFLIETTLPQIKYTDANGNTIGNYPKVKFADENTLNLAILLNGKIMDSNFKISKSPSTILSTDSLAYNGKLVIKNA